MVVQHDGVIKLDMELFGCNTCNDACERAHMRHDYSLLGAVHANIGNGRNSAARGFQNTQRRDDSVPNRSIESNNVQVRVGSDRNLVHIVLWSHKE